LILETGDVEGVPEKVEAEGWKVQSLNECQVVPSQKWWKFGVV
jgi:hypothetical protein